MYIAPEVINGDDYNYKVDIYSFSMVMYQVLTGEKLSLDPVMPSFLFFQNVLDGKRPSFEGFNIKPSIEELVQRCWSADPDERPSAQEIFEKFSSNPDYYLDDIDEDKFNAYINSIK
mgnify:CR=1 FL=1